MRKITGRVDYILEITIVDEKVGKLSTKYPYSPEISYSS